MHNYSAQSTLTHSKISQEDEKQYQTAKQAIIKDTCRCGYKIKQAITK